MLPPPYQLFPIQSDGETNPDNALCLCLGSRVEEEDGVEVQYSVRVWARKNYMGHVYLCVEHCNHGWCEHDWKSTSEYLEEDHRKLWRWHNTETCNSRLVGPSGEVNMEAIQESCPEESCTIESG